MKNNKRLLAYYGLKYNPFLPDIPVDALWHPPRMDAFIIRLDYPMEEYSDARILQDTKNIINRFYGKKLL